MTAKILLVDDEPNVLAAYQRQLRKNFDIEVASGGEEGLQVIEGEGPFAVIVSDLRMPGMDGIQFLANARRISPDSARIILTGYADLYAVIDAVNEDNIFRFLTKPCSPEILTSALRAGISQYGLKVAEREILEKTLSGSVKVLIEILSLVNPAAFSRATRIRRYVQHIADRMELDNRWQVELAAMLSQIGCVTLPTEMMEKIFAEAPLSEGERLMYASHPHTAHNLLVNIPRLEPIARMVDKQQLPFRETSLIGRSPDDKKILQGIHILKACLDYDQLTVQGATHTGAMLSMRQRGGEYDPKILDILETLETDNARMAIKNITLEELQTGMIAQEDIRDKRGVMLVPKGQEITYPVLVRMQNFARGVGLVEPFCVLIPGEEADGSAPEA